MIRLGEVHKLKPEEFQNKHHFCNIVLELLEAELSSRSYANAITTFTFTASMYSYLPNNRACTAPVFWRIFHYARSYSGYARAEALVPQRELQRIFFQILNFFGIF